jgi:metal-sulfur cluster biosynthetic enzyme
MPATQEQVYDALRLVEDPELGMDIVDLGLVYDVSVDAANVKVLYSLTSMGCPAGQMIEEQILEVCRALDGVEDVSTELTFTPPWTPDMMSDDAKFVLGF